MRMNLFIGHEDEPVHWSCGWTCSLVMWMNLFIGCVDEPVHWSCGWTLCSRLTMSLDYFNEGVTILFSYLYLRRYDIVFQFFFLHEAVSHRWKIVILQTVSLYPECNCDKQRGHFFWFYTAWPFFDWVRLVGMEINTALCIWCSPYLLCTRSAGSGEAAVCVCVCVCVLTRSQCVEHNNSSSSWSKWLVCVCQTKNKEKQFEIIPRTQK